MRKYLAVTVLLFVIAGANGATSPATAWQEGKHYFAIQPAQPTDVPVGKIEVLEVFSYGCPYCYQVYPTIAKLQAALPKNAQMCYLPASFIPSEDWPMFQRAYYTAQDLGIADKTHGAIFKSVWQGGDLAIVDANTNRLKRPAPTIDDAAAFYSRIAGIKVSDFMKSAASFPVALKMQHADDRIKAMRILETPTLVVNGKYRVTLDSAGGHEQLIALVKWLVAKESK